ncbi:MAG: MFS transporter, partial [Microbacterium sp.]|nr:MFS transporter [Microbacterium sp.]
IGAAAFGFWGYLPQFLETPATTGWGLGLGVQAAGLALLPLLAGMSGIGFAAGAIARILPLRVMLAIGALLMAVGVGSAIASHTALWQLSVAGGLFGLGIGLSYASMSSIVVQSVPADRTGVATGVNANLRTIGSAVGSALMSAIVFGSTGSDGSPAQTGYDVAWLSVAAMAVLAAAIVMAVRPRRSVAQSDDDVETVEDGELASAA